jgi:hypothetical protein
MIYHSRRELQAAKSNFWLLDLMPVQILVLLRRSFVICDAAVISATWSQARFDKRRFIQATIVPI